MTMKWNEKTPKMRVDPESYEVRADGEVMDVLGDNITSIESVQSVLINAISINQEMKMYPICILYKVFCHINYMYQCGVRVLQKISGA